MNRCYKIIFNRALGVWQVVAEFAAAQGKSGRSGRAAVVSSGRGRRRMAAVGLSAVLASVTPMALHAQTFIDGDDLGGMTPASGDTIVLDGNGNPTPVFSFSAPLTLPVGTLNFTSLAPDDTIFDTGVYFDGSAAPGNYTLNFTGFNTLTFISTNTFGTLGGIFSADGDLTLNAGGSTLIFESVIPGQTMFAGAGGAGGAIYATGAVEINGNLSASWLTAG
ncbi:MAG: ESPR domain-containing protein, partial [Zoogloeaceae bacterium]|nr:ESPR domain-containing protein [Zoogloeaceae bacterium]